MRGFVLLLLAAVVLCWLGILLSLPATSTPELPSAFAGADAAQEMDRGASAPLPDGSYPPTLAEEVQETDSPPVNASLLTMLVLCLSFGASVLRMLLTNARRQGAICSSSGDDRRWLSVAYEDPSFLGVFRL
jgi:hypothetical protein